MLNRITTAAALCLLLSAPAYAETFKCKIEQSRLVFQVDVKGATGDVSIGSLTDKPALAYKGVSVTTDAASKTVNVEATQAQYVGKSANGKCGVARSTYRLSLTPKDAKAYVGRLEIAPLFDEPAGKCPGFPPPDNLNESVFENVNCLKS